MNTLPNLPAKDYANEKFELTEAELEETSRLLQHIYEIIHDAKCSDFPFVIGASKYSQTIRDAACLKLNAQHAGYLLVEDFDYSGGWSDNKSLWLLMKEVNRFGS